MAKQQLQYNNLSQRYSPQEEPERDDFVTWLGKSLIGSALGVGVNLGNTAIQSGAQEGGWLDEAITPDKTLEARAAKAALQAEQSRATTGEITSRSKKNEAWEGVENYRTQAGIYGDTINAATRGMGDSLRTQLGLMGLQQKMQQKKGNGPGRKEKPPTFIGDAVDMGYTGPDGRWRSGETIKTYRAMVGPQAVALVRALLPGDSTENAEEIAASPARFEQLIDEKFTPAPIAYKDGRVVQFPVEALAPTGATVSPVPEGVTPKGKVGTTDKAKMEAAERKAAADRAQEAALAQAAAQAVAQRDIIGAQTGALVKEVDPWTPGSGKVASDAIGRLHGPAVSGVTGYYSDAVRQSRAPAAAPSKAPQQDAPAFQADYDRAKAAGSTALMGRIKAAAAAAGTPVRE